MYNHYNVRCFVNRLSSKKNILNRIELRRFWSEKDKPSLIENTGSVARDHLANERTFLAWARTSLALFGAGIALESLEFNTLSGYTTKLNDNNNDVLPLFLNSKKKHIAGLSFISLGGTFMIYSSLRYFQVYRALNKGMFVPNVKGIYSVIGVSGIILCGTLYLIESNVDIFNKK